MDKLELGKKYDLDVVDTTQHDITDSEIAYIVFYENYFEYHYVYDVTYKKEEDEHLGIIEDKDRHHDTLNRGLRSKVEFLEMYYWNDENLWVVKIDTTTARINLAFYQKETAENINNLFFQYIFQ